MCCMALNSIARLLLLFIIINDAIIIYFTSCVLELYTFWRLVKRKLGISDSCYNAPLRRNHHTALNKVLCLGLI